MATFTRTMTSPAMTSPSLTTSLSKIPFKLLELKVISAHDLPPVSKVLHTYVMAWVHPDNKMITPVDHKGNTSPAWNYRMVFGVDDKFLSSESSALTMEIYNISRLSNKPIGTTSLPVETLLNNAHSEIAQKPLKLQISRPTGDLQGLLIVTVNLVTTTIRNRNEGDHDVYGSPRTIMIRQISQRLNDSESSKRMSFHEDEEENDDGAFSDPERGTDDHEMKPSPLDVADPLKNGGLYSPHGEHSAHGTSEFDKWIEAGDHNTEEAKNLQVSSSSNNVVKSGEDKVSIKKEEPKVRRHRRHSDGGGLFSYFTSGFEKAFICGAGSMSNKNMNNKLKKKTKSKKSKGHPPLPVHEI